jgi:hypothetical protein
VSITSISAAALGQYVFQASNSTPLKQTLQTLQSSLSSGDLNGAQSAFQTLQTLYQIRRRPVEALCLATRNSPPT